MQTAWDKFENCFRAPWLGSAASWRMRRARDLTRPKKQGKGKVSPMNRLSELKENRKLDNKGFSLVELIIVIAIMAVLIGVLAPQYLKYVEKSRVSADADQIDTLISAVEIYSAENGVVTGKITIKTDGTLDVGSTLTSAFTDAGLDTSNIKVTSTMFKKGADINFSDTGVTVTGTNKSEIAKALGRKEGA